MEWLSIAKHKKWKQMGKIFDHRRVNKWAKYFAIGEFWNPITNRKKPHLSMEGWKTHNHKS